MAADNVVMVDRALVASLTVGELELLEDRTGRPLSRLFDADAPRGTLLRTLAFIVQRREDPSATWEAAGDARVELAADAETEVGSSTADPTRGGRGRSRA